MTPGTCYGWITDADIDAAVPFDGYDMVDRTKWPAPYYPWSPAAWPAHAYHLQRLARVMAERGWVGPPPVVRPGASLYYDGNHRVRAARYLAARGVNLTIPEPTTLRETA